MIMSKVILILTLVIFHEDRAGPPTAQWAVAHAVIVRMQDPRFPSDPLQVILQPNQFPWAPWAFECRPNWMPLDTRAWHRARRMAKLIWAARDRIRHDYACFHLTRSRYVLSRGHSQKRYGVHTLWQC